MSEESAAQISDETAASPPGRPFVKGQSGNPSGRPKGLARKVREILGDDDGESIARLYASAMAGQLPNPLYDPEHPDRHDRYVIVDVKDRLMAGKLLAERGWGKPPAYAPIEDDDPLDLAQRETDELAAEFDGRMDELAERRAAKKPEAATG